MASGDETERAQRVERQRESDLCLGPIVFFFRFHVFRFFRYHFGFVFCFVFLVICFKVLICFGF